MCELLPQQKKKKNVAVEIAAILFDTKIKTVYFFLFATFTLGMLCAAANKQKNLLI